MTHSFRSLPAMALILIPALLLGACQKQAPPAASAPAESTPGPATAATTPKPAPTQNTVAADAPVPVLVQNTGVPECDNFARKYEACLNDKVPESERGPFAQTLAQNRTAWRSAARSPSGKSTLVPICNQAQAAGKAALAQYGCTDL